jgi:Carboxypeptidase regulatory-like domain/Polysaccharide lyase family 4, domain II
MRSAVVIVVLLSLFPALGWQQPTPASSDSVQKCAISGMVTEAENGQPLRGAKVDIEGPGAGLMGGVTDDRGRFEIKNIPPGRYQLWASRPGSISMRYGQRTFDNPGHALTLAPGQDITDISFHLFREAVITGHIYDENGVPIQGAWVQAQRYGYMNGKRQLQAVGGVQTDDRGEFRLYDLTPGRYYISASYGNQAPAKNTSYSPTYYPGVVDPSTASPITVRPGDEFPGVDFSIQTVTAFRVRGRVTGIPSGHPAAHIYVGLVSNQKGKQWFAAGGGGANVRDAQGDFDIPNVRPGSYNLSAGYDDQGKQYQAQQVIQVSDSDVNGVVLALVPTATIHGRVHAGGSVDLSNLNVDVVPPGGLRVIRAPNPVNSDGTFVIKDVLDGSYNIQLAGLPPNAYLKRATLDGQDVLESGFTVANGQAPGSMLDLVVSSNGGRISGVVMLDGKLVSDARVTLAPADESKLSEAPWLWFKDAATDQNGNFLVQGIRPGKYLAFAWQDIQPGQDRDPEFLKRFQDRGYQVQVSENSVQTLQLKAIPANETLPAGKK